MPYTDKKEYNRRRREDGRKVTEPPKPQEFIAVDGEGVETSGGQVYSLLSASTGQDITRKEGLGTEECLRFLLSLKKNGVQVVGFGFSYDANMILKDLEPEELLSLYEQEECWFRGTDHDYKIQRVKGKTFTISQYTRRRWYHERTERQRSVIVWDSFGFFQGSFVQAIEQWKITLSDEETRVLIEGKSERGGFLWENIENLKVYNLLECKLLVLLMERVQSTLRALDLYLNRWDGAGAVAACMMKKYKVAQHIVQDYPEEVLNAMMRAYFGGRTQCVQFGVFNGPVYHYDLNSAYPSAYLDLPTCKGTWHTTDRFIPGAKYGMYQVTWKIPEKDLITPFPYRLDTGSITYPRQGRGIYHAALVAIALKRWPKCITIEKGWLFTPESDVRPFAFIKDFMVERLRLKALGDERHIMMKLGANSIYGKTAQGVSYKNHIPPYQNYFWAGMITCWAQCQLLAAALQDESAVIMFGTDAIFTTRPLNLALGKDLGTWEDCGIMDRFEVYQPGLYRMLFNDEEPQTKTRGFHKDEVDFDTLRRIWEEKRYGGCYPAEVTRFRGYEISMAQNNPGEWRTWKDDTKTINLRPGGFGTVNDPGRKSYHDFSKRNNYRYDYIHGGEELSAPYDKKNLTLPAPDNTLIMEQWEFLDNPAID